MPRLVRSQASSSRGESMERTTGLEPVSSVWKTEALPIRRRPHCQRTWRPCQELNLRSWFWRPARCPQHTATYIGLTDRICPGVVLLHRQAPLYSATANTHEGSHEPESNRHRADTSRTVDPANRGGGRDGTRTHHFSDTNRAFNPLNFTAGELGPMIGLEPTRTSLRGPFDSPKTFARSGQDPSTRLRRSLAQGKTRAATRTPSAHMAEPTGFEPAFSSVTGTRGRPDSPMTPCKRTSHEAGNPTGCWKVFVIREDLQRDARTTPCRA